MHNANTFAIEYMVYVTILNGKQLYAPDWSMEIGEGLYTPDDGSRWVVFFE